jgi:hypothetical protein
MVCALEKEAVFGQKFPTAQYDYDGEVCGTLPFIFVLITFRKRTDADVMKTGFPDSTLGH